MTATEILLIVAGALALGDWIAVALRRTRIEYVLKPATLGALVVVAVLAHVGHDVRPWLIAALALGVLGDVGLMFSRGDEPDAAFLGGLGAFLLGHACYLVAFLQFGVTWKYALAGALVTLGIAGLALPAVLRGAVRTGGRELAVVVGIYALVLGAMSTLAVGTNSIAVAVGGVLFLGSDTLLARERFVGPVRGVRGSRRRRAEPAVTGDVLVIVSYHAAQALILLGLITDLLPAALR